MNLSTIREILRSRGILLTKSLGQNFLHDQNQARKIVALGELSKGDQVLEVGPGLGALTELLLASGARILALEKDGRLCEVLRQRFDHCSNFELLNVDALDFLKTASRDWTGWKLISNLPYSAGSPILVELATAAHPPERMAATLQLEVVQRIIARPGEESFGQLSLFLQLAYEPREWFKIPPACFFPPPEVDSACVLLCRRASPLLPPEAAGRFKEVVKLAFSERRKMIRKLLRRRFGEAVIAEACSRIGIAPQARAENLSLAQFVELTRLLA